jgi:3-hydroxyisobutyrate dehydrogenase-like beta-hydroxyacid dehydrogenase
LAGVGFIGLGIMGSRQAANLARAGFEVTVYNRTRERADAWAAEHSGHVAATPREVAERSETVITMVVDGPQVDEMLLGEDGAVHGARPGTLFVDMSTIGPADTRRIAGELTGRPRPRTAR